VLSITECKKKLNKNGVHYEDFEIELIRNVLYNLADVCHKKIKKENENDNTTINGIV
jgi:hypothetical protein